ncbi:MAG: hypothetical protein Q4F34_04335 [Prevotellaceae bacterium]|nr:hypothetical protein [Prevotellaceae bacterium]
MCRNLQFTILLVLFVFVANTLSAQTTDELLKTAGNQIEKENWQDALDTYNKVVQKDHDNAAAFYFRAYVNEKLHRYKFARSDYEQFLKIAPFNYEGMLGLALLNQKDKHYTEAYDQINNLVEMYPDSVSAYIARAGIEEERSMLEPCIFDWGEAIRLAPNVGEYYVARAERLIRVGRKEEATRDLDKAVELGINASTVKYLYKRIKRQKQ